MFGFFFLNIKKFFSFPTNFVMFFLLRAAFTKAAAFNSDVSSWDVSNVVDFTGMFLGATSFNGDVSAWNVASMSEAVDIFAGTDSFVLGSWCSSSWAASPHAGDARRAKFVGGRKPTPSDQADMQKENYKWTLILYRKEDRFMY